MWKRRTRREVVGIGGVIAVVLAVVEMMVAGSGRRLEREFEDGVLLKCKTPKNRSDKELMNQELMTLWYQ